MEKKILTETAKYLQSSKVRTTLEDNKVVVEVGGKKTEGFVCGTLSLVRLKRKELEGNTVLEKCLTQHWLTYCTTDLFHCPTFEALNGCLQHINKELLNRSFLCGYAPTVADLVVFLALHPFMCSWSFLQKEQYMNISRWFNSMQKDETLNKTYTPVQFSRTLLYDTTGRTH
ncbi:eukaryotic translation elongation factor 1 epsilon-1-like [Homarus americanus]|uniref:Eukaryotic translation elongation factor 1 epsilon-1-like n=1 Tax=Homarus americanus TaxID=6706 RepID=A0A8J5TJ59_HOMAM|nr:eukaryotic translation elongation factor 1 epsilon-1-like [Homarus americanus]KAG7173058.1 Eukaryotic translation elongation factor 1 epsilon-1-like [Homarus americanus]